MNKPTIRKNMKTMKYIPFTGKNYTRFTKKLTLNSNIIRKTLQSNHSLADSFNGVVSSLSEENNDDKTNAVTIACSPPRKREHSKCRKRKFKNCHKKKPIKKIRVTTLNFIEKSFKGLTAGNEFLYLPAQNTSLSTNTMYMIRNRSYDATLEIQVEVSPNEKNYFVDTTGIKIKPKSNYVTTPLRFAKFTRVSFKTVEQGTTARVDVYFQTQTQLGKTQRKNCKKMDIPISTRRFVSKK